MLTTAAFIWSVCIDGYEWVKPHEDDLDVTRVDTFFEDSTHDTRDWNLRARSRKHESYAPFRERPDLFIRLRDLAGALSRDAVLAFACEYGHIIQPSGGTDRVAFREWRRSKELAPLVDQWARAGRFTAARRRRC
jgi:hypothetical protein